jgi:transcription initiation factor TFIID subunit 7
VNGKLRFEGKQYQLTVLNLPCVTECYKTYDDINLVKVGDVGQVLVVGEIQETEATTGFATDGVAPPMRNARQRIFRKAISVGTDVVHQVEGQILDILAVSWECSWPIVVTAYCCWATLRAWRNAFAALDGL